MVQLEDSFIKAWQSETVNSSAQLKIKDSRKLDKTQTNQRTDTNHTNRQDNNTVKVGSVVRILDMECEEEDEYRIVSTADADSNLLFVSTESPISSALVRKHVDDVIDVETPGGMLRLRVLSIS